MADGRRRHRAHHARRRHARAGPEQDAGGIQEATCGWASSKNESAPVQFVPAGRRQQEAWRARISDVASDERERRFQPGDAVGRAEQLR